jgi:hypothetical protein
MFLFSTTDKKIWHIFLSKCDSAKSIFVLTKKVLTFCWRKWQKVCYNWNRFRQCFVFGHWQKNMRYLLSQYVKYVTIGQQIRVCSEKSKWLTANSVMNCRICVMVDDGSPISIFDGYDFIVFSNCTADDLKTWRLTTSIDDCWKQKHGGIIWSILLCQLFVKLNLFDLFCCIICTV